MRSVSPTVTTERYLRATVAYTMMAWGVECAQSKLAEHTPFVKCDYLSYLTGVALKSGDTAR